MKRNILTLPLLLLTTLTLGSCAGTSTSGGGTSTSYPSINEWEDDSVDDIVTDGAGNIVFDDVEISMWSVTTNPDSVYQDQIIDEFNRAYEGQIHVTVYHESRYSIFSNLVSTVAQDPENAPDLFYGYGERIASLVDNDIFVPMGPYLEMANIGFDRNNFEKALIDNCYIGDMLYGIPYGVDSAIIFARKDILEENGLAVPTNLTELADVCDALVDKAAAGELMIRGEDSDNAGAGDVYAWRKYNPTLEGTYYPFPISSGDMWINAYVAQTAVYQNGGSLVREDDGHANWNSPEAEKGLQILREFLYPTATSVNRHPFSKADLNYDAGVTEFLRGTGVFKLDGAWSGYTNYTLMDNMYGKDGGAKENLAIINLGNMLTTDNTTAYSKTIFGDSHAASIVSSTTSRTKRVAASILANFLAENSGGVWTQAGHLPASLIVQNSHDLYLDNEYYEKYVQYYGSPSQYVTALPTKYYDEVSDSFSVALKAAMASTYKDRPIADILQENYEDCELRISDREDL